MKLFNTQACMSSELGTFAPWFAGSDAATQCDAASSRARRAATGVEPARRGTDRVQRGHGWAAVDSASLSGFR